MEKKRKKNRKKDVFIFEIIFPKNKLPRGTKKTSQFKKFKF